MENIIYAIIVLGGMGLFFGFALAIAAKIFEVKQDERVSLIIEALPGANCGGCGFVGCSSFAEAVAEGRARTGGCPVGGAKTARDVARIMGATPEEFEKKAARVKCSGVSAAAHKKYTYEGIQDCVAANKLMGGDKICSYACLGLGTCVNVCRFGAIKLRDGIAVIDPEKCTACGKCVAACPKKVIEIMRIKQVAFVACNSRNKGAVVRQICEAGCIGCKVCEKTCNNNAIIVENNIAKVDVSKCNNCGECVAKCPKRVII